MAENTTVKNLKNPLIFFFLLVTVATGVNADSREDLKKAEESMKAATSNVQTGINKALTLIRQIKGESAAERTDDVLAAIEVIESDALNAIDQLALNGPFMNSLNDVRIEIHQLLKTVEKMEPSTNRDRNLEKLKLQQERFEELQRTIEVKEGEVTLMLGQFSGLKRNIEISIRVGKIDDLISNLESVQTSLDNMKQVLGQVLQVEVGEIEKVVVTN
jgi:hypothetical protein